MRCDKELSVSQLISSWLRLHGHTVNNLINTSLQTSHTPNWLPSSAHTCPHSHMYLAKYISHTHTQRSFYPAFKAQISLPWTTQSESQLVTTLCCSDATIHKTARQFLEASHVTFYSPKRFGSVSQPRSSSMQFANSGTSTITTFVQLCGSEPAAALRVHRAHRPCVLPSDYYARTRIHTHTHTQAQTTKAKPNYTLWCASIGCYVTNNHGEAICTRQNKITRFRAELVNRYKGVSPAAVLAAGSRIKVCQHTWNWEALVQIQAPK